VANNTTKTRKGPTNPPECGKFHDEPKPVASYDVTKGPKGPQTTKQRGHGAATKGFTSHGPMA
jgi:hypothetical protein